MIEAPILSVVAPCYNEQGNLIPLVTAIREALEPLKISYEIVIADDCSRDDSWKILRTLGAEDRRIRAVRLNRNCGQSAADAESAKNAMAAHKMLIEIRMHTVDFMVSKTPL